jgi:hypothetical protein
MLRQTCIIGTICAGALAVDNMGRLRTNVGVQQEGVVSSTMVIGIDDAD